MLCLCFFLLASGALAPAEQAAEPRVSFFGDGRLRLEQDWDSLRGDGTLRDDRLRFRFRLRGGVQARLGGNWSALVQARSGSDLSQQSPHVTLYDFDGGDTGPYDFNLDRWLVRYRSGGLDAWAGRNELSFWHQDDMFVFDNVTYAGLGASYRLRVGRAHLTWNLNYVALPVGMRRFSGTGVVTQLVYERESAGSGLTAAAGLYMTRADPDDPDAGLLLTENGTRDYAVLNLQLQYRARAVGKPVRLGVNYSHNAQSYAEAAPGSFSEFHREHVDAYVIEAAWGEMARGGDLLIGYYYAHVEALAVHSSYTQDDWVRWGSGGQARATNFRGSELRAVYTLRPGMNLFARLFLLDAIHPLVSGDTATETGNRFRLDWNVSF